MSWAKESKSRFFTHCYASPDVGFPYNPLILRNSCHKRRMRLHPSFTLLQHSYASVCLAAQECRDINILGGKVFLRQLIHDLFALSGTVVKAGGYQAEDFFFPVG